MAGRAANGESTIYQAADGRWHGYVSVGTTVTGKPDRRHVTSKTRAAVVAKVRDIERKRSDGTLGAASTPTVAAWLEHWLTTIAPRRVRQRTLESYESAVRKHLVPGVGRRRLDRLRPEHLDALYTAMLDDGYSPATVLRQHRILSRALTVAVQRGHIARNVVTLVDPPAQKQSDVATALDLGEARAVLTAAAHTRNPARWTVALALGLRQSEALALQWKDIDLLTCTLTVRRSIHRVRGGGLVYEEPKTRRSQRTLALPLPLVAQLQDHKAAQLGERMQAGSDWHDEDLVFAQPNGRPVDKKTDYDDWARLLKSAGVRHVRLHDGRHTAATLLLSENVHPRVVMELLGHSQMRTTMDIYSHVMPALAREAADRMSTLLLPDSGASTATTTATRDDSGRPPDGERPGQRVVLRAHLSNPSDVFLALVPGVVEARLLPPTPPPALPARVRTFMPSVEQRLLIIGRYEDGATMAEIAVELDCSRKRIMRVLHEAGVQTSRPSLRPDQLDDIYALYVDGWSLAEIGRKYGCAHTTVRDFMIANGLVLRPRRGWRYGHTD